MRDHTKLRAFELADQLAIEIYRVTQPFPREEQFGLTSQMRRAAVSAASNIVEGSARYTEVEYLRFLDIAFGSVRELDYQISLASRLGFLKMPYYDSIAALAQETSKVLGGLIRSLRQ
jgi:four helix bundle protein